MKELKKLTNENEILKNTQGFLKQEIRDEVKAWKEEKDKIRFKEIFEQEMESSENRKEVIKVLKTN